MQTWNKRRLINTLAIFIIAGVIVYLIGSGHLPRKQQNETKNIQGFAFDTTYQITIYQGGTKKTLQKCVSECSSYENVISRTKETSTVYRINALANCVSLCKKDKRSCCLNSREQSMRRN